MIEQQGDSLHSIAEAGLVIRPRRHRLSAAHRALVRETHLTADDLIYPIFVRHGADERREIASMPGIAQLSVEGAVAEARRAASLGIRAVLLFGLPAAKDVIGRENFSKDGIVQQATRALKKAIPELLVITDVCMCEYTDHGHCGVLNGESEVPLRPQAPEGYVLNDETLQVLGKVAISHAEAGADIVAPSGMMDGMVATIRGALDSRSFKNVAIMPYSVKYASGFYEPFRDAAAGAPSHGDRKSHQMDPANVREAMREADLDVREGADFLMIKPALSYLDVIYRCKLRHPNIPLVAYNVSGEYAMIKAAVDRGLLAERETVFEILLSIKRAGADLIITYHALEMAGWLSDAAGSQVRGLDS